MSAENLEPSGTPPPHPSTTFHHDTQTSSSKEEGAKGAEQSLAEGLLPPEEDETWEKDQYLEEEADYLKGNEYQSEQDDLHEQDDLKGHKNLLKKELLEGKVFLYEKFLDADFKAHSSQTLPGFRASRPLLEDTMPSTSFGKHEGELLTSQDQSTQTEWIYESKMVLSKSRSPGGEESTVTLATFKSESQAFVPSEEPQVAGDATDFDYKESFWDRVLKDPIGTLEGDEVFEDEVSTVTYQSVFRTVLKEMAVRNELEEDITIPLTGHLEGETRRKLGILLKKNFEKYKETIYWIMRKRENLLSQRTGETTFTFHLCSIPPQDEEEEEEPEKEVKKRRRRVRRTKTLELDTDWINSKTKVLQGDGKIILYPDETIFQILFPDGSGQIYYPSGHPAMLILSIKEGKFTYIILEDSAKTCIRALINNSGHATFHDENGDIWLSLSQNLGYYFAKDEYQKAWNWWDLSLHVHAPPIQSISLKINRYVEVQIRSQDKIIFHFTHHEKHVCLNLGTKFKYITLEVLSEMKKKSILEMEVSPTAQKIQILLGKMSRILRLLTIPDLERFIWCIKILPTRRHRSERELAPAKLQPSPSCPGGASENSPDSKCHLTSPQPRPTPRPGRCGRKDRHQKQEETPFPCLRYSISTLQSLTSAPAGGGEMLSGPSSRISKQGQKGVDLEYLLSVYCSFCSRHQVHSCQHNRAAYDLQCDRQTTAKLAKDTICWYENGLLIHKASSRHSHCECSRHESACFSKNYGNGGQCAESW
ncbi:glutamate-rich protein 6B [Moschus berezovskii]|uniref:glutamate-rich protein 6B n=1 Tax=Moschus berezovskii TaxID=68408 RepID=UPI002444FF1C|nr:glutamate-rich protein 6B [Moschus berezovskii]